MSGGLLKSLLETEVFKPVQDKFDAQSIHNRLDKAAEEEEIETITFGMETEDGSIVKVYVAVDDADGFEEALGEMLGSEDDIEEILDELSKEYDIVDVKWPDEATDGEDEDLDNEPDGSESMNDRVEYQEEDQDFPVSSPKTYDKNMSLGQRFLRKVTENDIDGTAEDNPADELEDIKEQIEELIDNAVSIVRQTDEWDRANGYWIPHIKMALSKDHDYLGGSMVTMQDTIDSLRNEGEDNAYEEDLDKPKKSFSVDLYTIGEAERAIEILEKDGIPFTKNGQLLSITLDRNSSRAESLVGYFKNEGIKFDEVTDSLIEYDESGTDSPSEINWEVAFTDAGTLILKSEAENINIEFDESTMLEIIGHISNTEPAKVKNIDGAGPYIFSPSGEEYILKTPENKNGYRLSSNILDQILE